MLVLSRRLNERIRFPGFDMSIQILSIQGGVVRLGIEAPPEVGVVRDELPDRTTTWGLPLPEPGDRTMTDVRQQFISRQLQTASQALGLARFQLRTGQVEELQLTLDQIQQEIQALRRHLVGHDPFHSGQAGCRRREQGSEAELLAGYLD
jgi:carbon storage regulator CsrA